MIYINVLLYICISHPSVDADAIYLDIDIDI